MDERFNLQSESDLEGRETNKGVENQALQDATNEPGARIEEIQNFEQAEAVEANLVEAVERAAGITVDRNAHETVPNTEFQENAVDDEEKDAATPINVPGPVVAEVAKPSDPHEPPPPPDRTVGMGLGSQPGGEVSATPINLPNPVENQVGGRPGGAVSATPINVPGPVDNSLEGGPGGRPGGEVSATPINLPNPVAECPDPGSPPPPPDRLADASFADDGSELMQKIGAIPQFGSDPYPQSLDAAEMRGQIRGDQTEGDGKGNGGEATPINLPEMPDDDQSATPINVP